MIRKRTTAQRPELGLQDSQSLASYDSVVFNGKLVSTKNAAFKLIWKSDSFPCYFSTLWAKAR